MDNQKDYVIDTNVLLDDPSSLFKLRNGQENNIYIPYHVLLELNKFKKMGPYTRYISDLVLKLHQLRPANRIFINPEEHPPAYNTKRFELLPLTYIRGMNIENAVVIVDEIQNMSRAECRAMLSRMGEGVKCICLGDIHQVDNPYLNIENNGMNWVVKKFKGSKIYAHLVLKGERSRGPITDLVIKSGL